jgi:hypothetical protein
MKPHSAGHLYVIQHMIGAVRSYFVGLKASSRFGRAVKLRDAGRKEEALELAREALIILRAPGINRAAPAEGSALSHCTILVEGLATELNQPGADSGDIADSLAYLRLVENAGVGRIPFPDKSKDRYLCAWISYLESRTGTRRTSAI